MKHASRRKTAVDTKSQKLQCLMVEESVLTGEKKVLPADFLCANVYLVWPYISQLQIAQKFV